MVQGLISTHIPSQRMTHRTFCFQCNFYNFDSHPLAEDDIFPASSLSQINGFRLTSPRRGWQVAGRPHWLHYYISTHIPSQRMTSKVLRGSPDRAFRLTSPRRGWLWCRRCKIRKWYFDSHPLAEDDFVQGDIKVDVRLFRLTSSHRGWRTWHSEAWQIKPIFRLTSSHRGWHFILLIKWLRYRISTHILSQRMTAYIEAR